MSKDKRHPLEVILDVELALQFEQRFKHAHLDRLNFELTLIEKEKEKDQVSEYLYEVKRDYLLAFIEDRKKGRK